MTKKTNINAAVFHAEDIIEALTQAPVDAAPLTAGQRVVAKTAVSSRQTVDAHQLSSLYALLAYAAHEQQVLQETVQAIVEAQFGVRHISAIKATDFSRVVSFIADLRVDQRIN